MSVSERETEKTTFLVPEHQKMNFWNCTNQIVNISFDANANIKASRRLYLFPDFSFISAPELRMRENIRIYGS